MHDSRASHMGPPCGTASRTRLIQRFAPDPPIGCTDQHPDGLPHLEGDLAARVRAPLCTAPNQSFMWDTQAMRSWLQPTLSTPSSIIVSMGQPGHKCTRFVHCLPGLELLTYSGTHVLRSGQDGGRLGRHHVAGVLVLQDLGALCQTPAFAPGDRHSSSPCVVQPPEQQSGLVWCPSSSKSCSIRPTSHCLRSHDL